MHYEKKLISHKMITLHTRAVRTTNLWLLAPSTKATKLQLTFAPPLSALKLCHCAALCDEAIWRVFRPPFHPPPQKIRAIIQKRTVCYCTLARTLWTNKSFRYVHCSGLFVCLFVVTVHCNTRRFDKFFDRRFIHHVPQKIRAIIQKRTVCYSLHTSLYNMDKQKI